MRVRASECERENERKRERKREREGERERKKESKREREKERERMKKLSKFCRDDIEQLEENFRIIIKSGDGNEG